MTNEAIGVLAAFALVLALASGARANWQTDASRARLVNVRRGERWRLRGTATGRDITDTDVEQYRIMMPATGIAQVEEMHLGDDRRTFEAVLLYERDAVLKVNQPSKLGPTISLTLDSVEKLS